MNKKITLLILSSSALLLITPLALLLIGWQWQPVEHPIGGKSMLWIANSAAKPWGVLTIAVALFLLFFRLKLPKKLFIQLAIIIVGTMVVGQLLKIAVKNTVKEPRPYVVWVSKQLDITTDYFYSVPRDERAQLLDKGFAHSPLLPKWQLKHWRAETGYAFPSGHSLFAATLALFIFTIFMLYRHYILALLGLIWGIDVTAGRLVMGMHWASDVIVGILISTILVWCAFQMIERRFLLKS